MVELFIDDGKGNVLHDNTVSLDQQFWFRGLATSGDTVDVYFDEYGPYPPHDYVTSHWLFTAVCNSDGFFQSIPGDVFTISDTGTKDSQSNEIYSLNRSGTSVWQGIILESLGFTAIVGSDKSNVATLKVKVFPIDIKLALTVIGVAGIGAFFGYLIKKSMGRGGGAPKL